MCGICICFDTSAGPEPNYQACQMSRSAKIREVCVRVDIFASVWEALAGADAARARACSFRRRQCSAVGSASWLSRCAAHAQVLALHHLLPLLRACVRAMLAGSGALPPTLFNRIGQA